MFEIKVMIEAKELSQALEDLAVAIGATASADMVKDRQNAVAESEEISPAVPFAETKAEPAPVEAEQIAVEPIPSVEPVKEAAPEPEKVREVVQETNPAPSAPIDLEAISRAGAGLVDQGKMDKVIGILQQKYGLMAITQLKPEQYDAFAADLRALGADI